MLKPTVSNTLALALAAGIAAPSAFAQDAQSRPPPPQSMQEEAPPAADAHASERQGKPAPKTWSELDVNSNGSLSISEAAPMESLAKVFAKADADADGELTQDEYKTWLAANGNKQKPMQGG